MENEYKFRNFINYPLGGISKPKSRNCCGLNATGDPLPADTSVSTTVRKLTAFNYAKTGFALVGLFVVGKYLYTKFIK